MLMPPTWAKVEVLAWVLVSFVFIIRLSPRLRNLLLLKWRHRSCILHCKAGKNRSAGLMVACLMLQMNLSWEEADTWINLDFFKFSGGFGWLWMFVYCLSGLFLALLPLNCMHFPL